jgi:hypothetical protein
VIGYLGAYFVGGGEQMTPETHAPWIEKRKKV